MRLNQYIAQSGMCSRRNADKIILDGLVMVNNIIITQLGTKVEENDKVKVNGVLIKPANYIYILLNKPKNYITTTSDEKNRQTVLDIILPKLKTIDWIPKDLRLYPVGRLDRNTTGLLLLTNDGEMTQNLTHPKFNIEKIYTVELDKKINIEEMEQLTVGIELEDGFVKADDIAYIDNNNKCKLGIAIHSGKNRIIRRMFEHLGYEVKYLDRIVFADLTKKNLPRGCFRFLTNEEILKLKNLNAQKKHFIPPAKTFKMKKEEQKVYKFR